MNGRLYDPLLRRFLNADENIQDLHNTQNYNKYGYVMNNPLMYSDPSGEFFVFLGLGALFWKAVIIGAAVGLASYTVGLAVTGNLHQWNIGGALKSTLWGAVSFGIGEVFSTTLKTGFTIAESLKESLGGFGAALVHAGTHAISQGILAVVQGDSFLSAAAGGFFGSLGAKAWGGAMKNLGYEKFAQSTIGTVAFGALSGGIGAELSGGNFWQGAVTGGIVAGLNHVMHRYMTESHDDIIILNASKGASGLGHEATIIGNDKNGYVYISKDGRDNNDGSVTSGGKSKRTIKIFKTRDEAMKFAKTQYKFDQFLTIKTTAIQDFRAISSAYHEAKKDYHFIYNNCSDVIAGALTGAGLGAYAGHSVIPNLNFKEMRV